MAVGANGLIKKVFQRLWGKNKTSIESNYPFFCACILDTYFSALQHGANVSSLEGNVAVLPKLDKPAKLIETHTPLLIYNALVANNFPAHQEIEAAVEEIELSLSNGRDNEWIKLLLAWAKSGKPFKTEDVIIEALHCGSQLQIDRYRFESSTSEKLKRLQKRLFKLESEIGEWMKHRKESMSSPKSK